MIEILTETNIGWNAPRMEGVEFRKELEALLMKYCFTGVQLPAYNRIIMEFGIGKDHNYPVILQIVEEDGRKNITAALYKNKRGI